MTANDIAEDLRSRHPLVSIGHPHVGRLQGILPRYSVSWTERTDDAGNWGWSRTVWLRSRAWRFAASFVVIEVAS